MARRLSEFPKDKVESNAQYPWDRWLDGSVWKITKDSDFEEELDRFMFKLTLETDKRDLLIRMKLQDTSVIVQTFTPDQIKETGEKSPVKTTVLARKARVILNDGEVKELKKMKRMGYTLSEIAKHFDVSVATVTNKLKG